MLIKEMEGPTTQNISLHTFQLHVLTECEEVILERNNFITAVCKVFPMFTNFTSINKYKWISNLSHCYEKAIHECAHISN